ncbi:MAG: ABC transporter ATP-binding protein [Anaerolineaceae bacterium]|nr:ABC transporter ATP-binding protein [Anaerolineaceae bacterium]
MLELINIDSGYGDIEVLKEITFSAREGQIVSVLGANGAGKSTLMKTVFGFIQPTRGKILFEGKDITQLKAIQLLKIGISFLPEGRSNLPAMTVQENLEMGAYIRRDTLKIKADIEGLYKRFPILKEKRNIMAGNLSGGQQQILEIAMALMLKPKLILIDEPTLGLAPILVTEVFNIIQEINRSGTTIVLVEQNAKRALEISDYSFVMELGKIRMHGPAQELSQKADVIAAYLGER